MLYPLSYGGPEGQAIRPDAQQQHPPDGDTAAPQARPGPQDPPQEYVAP